MGCSPQLARSVRWKDALGRVREGKLAYAKGADELLGAMGSYSLTLEEATDLGGDNVLAVLRIAAKGRASGVPGSMSLFCLVTLRDGLIANYVEYSSRSAALKAVGLEE